MNISRVGKGHDLTNIINSRNREFSPTGPNIQAAIDDLPLGGGWVYLPPPVRHVIDTPLTMTKPVHLFSEVGRHADEVPGKWCAEIYLANGSDCQMLITSGNWFLGRLEGIRFDGNYLNNALAPGPAIMVGHAGDLLIDDCLFWHINAPYAVELAAHGCRFVHSYIEDVTQRFLRLSNYRNFVAHSHFRNADGDYGITFASNQQWIIDCDLDDMMGRPIGSSSGLSDIFIHDSRIVNYQGQAGIRVASNCLRWFIHDNLLDAMNVGLYGIELADATPDYIHMHDNHIRRYVTGCINTPGGGNPNGNVHDNVCEP